MVNKDSGDGDGGDQGGGGDSSDTIILVVFTIVVRVFIATMVLSGSECWLRQFPRIFLC